MSGNDPDGFVRYFIIASFVVTAWIVANILFVAHASGADATLRLAGSVPPSVAAEAAIVIDDQSQDSPVLLIREISNTDIGYKLWLRPSQDGRSQQSLLFSGARESTPPAIAQTAVPSRNAPRSIPLRFGTEPVTLVIQSN